VSDAIPSETVAWVLPSDWSDRLSDVLTESEWRSLREFVESERSEHDVYPPPGQMFTAFRLTGYEDTRVVILGQDPYHGPGEAHGLCFSVPSDLPKQPLSLRNILKELKEDESVELPSGDLEGWARQGVLLLNTTLTVRNGRANSHHGKGWERFTDGVLRTLNEKDHRVVFILWGSKARRKKKLITNPLHRIIESAHPSPLSAYRGFFGSKPFSTTNKFPSEVGLTPID
jgi:uracil-DNA glycosylase